MDIFTFKTLPDLNQNNARDVLAKMGFNFRNDTSSDLSISKHRVDIYARYNIDDKGLNIVYYRVNSRDTSILLNTCLTKLESMDYGGGFGYGYDWYGTYEIVVPFGPIDAILIMEPKNPS